MNNLIVDLSKYAFIILIAMYTMQCFLVLRKKNQDEIQFGFRFQNLLMLFIHLLAFVVMYIQTEKLHILIFYLLQFFGAVPTDLVIDEDALLKAVQLDPLPPEKGQQPADWLENTLRRAIALRHQTFLEMDDAGLRRCLLALLCALQPHPDLAESCGLLADLDDMARELKESAFSCRMDEQRSRLLEGDFSEANRTYAAAHSLEQVENGLQLED